MDVDVQVDVDVDVDEWSDLTLAHERLDVHRRVIEFLAEAVRIVSILSRLCRRRLGHIVHVQVDVHDHVHGHVNVDKDPSYNASHFQTNS